jgi:hypothetical protein
MKLVSLLISPFLFACSHNESLLEGAWTLTSAASSGTCSDSNGHLWSDLIFKNDSILIFESQFFKGNQAKYKIEGDTIKFLMEENPKYHFSLTKNRLEFNGEITIRGCKFRERKTYEKNESDYITQKILEQDSINHYQLSISKWCTDGTADIEKHVSTEYSLFTKNMNDSSGMDYFPIELDFKSPKVKFSSDLVFSFEKRQYNINHYNGHQLIIQFKSNDSSYFMQYRLCESRTIEL